MDHMIYSEENNRAVSITDLVNEKEHEVEDNQGSYEVISNFFFYTSLIFILLISLLSIIFFALIYFNV